MTLSILPVSTCISFAIGLCISSRAGKQVRRDPQSGDSISNFDISRQHTPFTRVLPLSCNMRTIWFSALLHPAHYLKTTLADRSHRSFRFGTHFKHLILHSSLKFAECRVEVFAIRFRRNVPFESSVRTSENTSSFSSRNELQRQSGS